MKKFFYRAISLGMSALLPLSALSIAMPSEAFDFDIFSRRYRHGQFTEEFEECATVLLEVGVREDQTAIACSEALEPTHLSECVSNIDTETVINELYALFACFRVRRPLELAECVVTIHDNVLETRAELAGNITVAATDLEPLALSTLDHCRRSLLPKRLSACVVGLSQQIPLTPAQALDTCIEAEDFPRELYVPSTNATLQEESLPGEGQTSEPPSFDFTEPEGEFDFTPLEPLE
ncbi:MAG: hypothetical protein J7647_03535 [Cyanobacteria bacterium SBLK]|nr:hypothetical protein [Cyanobacteria bacterium SBLK]